jgi:putative Holliday junction resolvase
MRLLGLDFGEKRIGVSWVDTDVILLAQPFDIIDNLPDDNSSAIAKISELTQLKKVEAIVLGYPRSLSGQATEQTEKVDYFKKELEGQIEIPIFYQDETLSTVMVSEHLSENTKGTKQRVDDQAAALILQDYIEIKFRGSRPLASGGSEEVEI